MSFLKGAFAFTKTKPRKSVSRSPLKLPADELYRELGPKNDVIDVRIADRKIAFDKEYGDWNTGRSPGIFSQNFCFFDLAGAESLGGTVSSVVAQKVRKQIETLEEENNLMKIKVEVLLNLVAESTAELTQTRH